ncbi:MAG: cell division topological specificity factor MinE [Desulfobacteraceae bacterium]|nr:MAG: cell division topological specificity factor MinE [Desulfobacteraceae bacterium]
MLTTWFRNLIGKNNSKEAAKTRLRFALIYDKLEVSNEILNDLQREIVEVISRYFEIDKNEVKLDIRKSDDLSLVFKTPIRAAKRREQRA